MPGSSKLKSKRLTISIIGAGRVGQTLGRLLHKSGNSIESVVCRTKPSARKAVAFIGSGTPLTSDLSGLAASKLFLLTVPDDEISKTAERMAVLRTDWSGSIVIHTSGSLSSDALKPMSNQGAAVASAHPLLSISSPKSGIEQIAAGYFCIEGDKPATSMANRLIKSLGARTFEIKSTDKAAYHAAAVLASPHLTALLSLSIQLLEQCGLSDVEARKVLNPLVASTVENLWRHGASAALTGPIKRADVSTVRRNLRALAEFDELAENIYRFLSLQGVRLSNSADLSHEKLEPIVYELLRLPEQQSR
jgi:predicted short-subunit dehydrogenase-like oxidoreductase (DUF2520 family)